MRGKEKVLCHGEDRFCPKTPQSPQNGKHQVFKQGCVSEVFGANTPCGSCGIGLKRAQIGHTSAFSCTNQIAKKKKKAREGPVVEKKSGIVPQAGLKGREDATHRFHQTLFAFCVFENAQRGGLPVLLRPRARTARYTRISGFQKYPGVPPFTDACAKTKTFRFVGTKLRGPNHVTNRRLRFEVRSSLLEAWGSLLKLGAVFWRLGVLVENWCSIVDLGKSLGSWGCFG